MPSIPTIHFAGNGTRFLLKLRDGLLSDMKIFLSNSVGQFKFHGSNESLCSKDAD